MRTVFFILALFLVGQPLFCQQQDHSRSKALLQEIVREHQRITASAEIRAEASAILEARSVQAMQRKTTWVDYPVSDGLFIESEIHAAVNPRDDQNIVVSAIREVIVQGQLGGLSCPLYSTTDGGWTWSESPYLTEPTEAGGVLMGGGDPVLAFDADGVAYFTWLNFFLTADYSELISELCWVTSDNGGWEWKQTENPVIARANMSPQDPAARFVDKQWLAVDRSQSTYRGNVYIAFLRAAANGLFINVLHKDAGEASFTAEEITVSQDSVVFVQFASIDVDDVGGVHVSYFASFDEQNYSLWHVRSTDGAKTFDPPTRIADVIVPKYSREDQMGEITGITQDRLYPCPQLAVGRGAYASHVYMTWTGSGIGQKEGNGTDIYFARSSDYGGTWSRPVIVNDDPRGVVRDQFYSAIAVNNAGVIALTWYDRREDENNTHARYYVCVSRNGGESFTRNEAVSTLPMNMLMTTNGWLDFGIGEYTQVVITDDAVIPFWTDGRKNNGDLLIYSANIDLQTLQVRHHAPIGAGFHLRDIWPQPASEVLNIRCTLERPMAAQLVLTDMLGRVITKQDASAPAAGDYTYSVSTEKLAPGSYRLLLLTEEGSTGRMLRVL